MSRRDPAPTPGPGGRSEAPPGAGGGRNPARAAKPPEEELDAYHEVCAYTLSLGDPEFLHQHVVDAFAAQHAEENTKPVALTMALVGLYLHVERGFTGREAQRAHMRLGRQKRSWPPFVLPTHRGPVAATQVLAAPPGPERHQAIHAWAEAVWSAYAEANRQRVVDFLEDTGIL